MRSRVRWGLLTVLLAGACRVESGSPPAGERPPQQGSGYSFETRRDPAPPSEHAVFDRRRERVAPGVVRLTIGAIIRTDRGRAAARAAMEKIVEDERLRDTTVAAIRVLCYLPPTPSSGGQSPLQPLGYLDWAPPSGWDALTPQSRAEFHRISVVWLVDVPELPARAP